MYKAFHGDIIWDSRRLETTLYPSIIEGTMGHAYNGIPGSYKKEGDNLHSILFSEKGRVQKNREQVFFYLRNTYVFAYNEINRRANE